jgi:hypothetical protein
MVGLLASASVWRQVLLLVFAGLAVIVALTFLANRYDR